MLDLIEDAERRLQSAIRGGRSQLTCLRLWSEFIRIRDENKCLACFSKHSLAAHHLCRKSFLPEAQLQTGNGITLCKPCHGEIHAGFNGRPDLSQPMDAQGGEKIDTMSGLFGLLLRDARKRNLLRDDFYYLSDDVLAKFKLLQGFDPFTDFGSVSLEQAYLIWVQSPKQTRDAVFMANGLAPPPGPLMPGLSIWFADK